jgi:hypothetical protein
MATAPIGAGVRPARFLPRSDVLKIEQGPADRPVPYEHNPRANDAAVDAVARSIEAFGFRQPVLVDGSGVVIIGHTRLRAAKQLGLTHVLAHVAEGLSEAQVKALRISACVLVVVCASSAPITALRISVAKSGELANCSFVLLAACWRSVSDSSTFPLTEVRIRESQLLPPYRHRTAGFPDDAEAHVPPALARRPLVSRSGAARRRRH